MPDVYKAAYNPYRRGSYFGQLFDNRRKAEAKYGVSKYVGDYPINGFGPKSKPITQKYLNDNRRWQASRGASVIAPKYTKQHEAAKQYLIDRGKENQKRYQEGVLWKNEPSKVPMPSVISSPRDIELLNTMGAGVANARIPGKTNNTTVG